MCTIFSKIFTPLLKNVCKLSTIEMKKFSNIAPVLLFRQNFSPRTEEKLNLQISHELNASQAYLAMSNFFGRTELSLKGTSSFFHAMSEEERGHAMELIKYQNMRGGRVKMDSIPKSKDEFTSISMAVEESLLIERSNTMALMELVHVAEKDGDIVTVDFITSKFLSEQVSQQFFFCLHFVLIELRHQHFVSCVDRR